MAIEFFTALIGAAIGAGTGLGAVYLQHNLANKNDRELAGKRKDILIKMLTIESKPWRDLEMMSKVIGASAEETKRLLFEIGARGSETENEVWALMSRKPLKGIDEGNDRSNDRF